MEREGIPYHLFWWNKLQNHVYLNLPAFLAGRFFFGLYWAPHFIELRAKRIKVSQNQLILPLEIILCERIESTCLSALWDQINRSVG